MSEITVDVPRAFKPLLAPKRYKAAYGGRGGAKSHFFAEQLLIRCYTQQTRAVCIREVQKSLKDSVRQLLVDKIDKLGLGPNFEVLESEIRGENGSLIIFVGMQNYNAENIKSLESFDIAWVEEAQSLSEKSLRLLRPTIRQDNSEIWFSWNPRFETDAVDQFFRGPNAPDPDMATVINVNWPDNPWFPEVLQKEKDADYANTPEMAEHVWGGGYQIIGEGSYYGKLLAEAEREGRITVVPYDPVSLVTTAWDLGAEDSTAIWFAQPVGLQWRILDYYENSGQALAHYAGVLKSKPYHYGDHILPHDAAHERLGRDSNDSLSVDLRNLGFNNRVLPVDDIDPGIEKARQLLPKCWFDAGRCIHGLKALRNYRREYDDARLTFKPNPYHDWASHGADAFRYLAIGLRQPGPKLRPVVYKEPKGYYT